MSAVPRVDSAGSPGEVAALRRSISDIVALSTLSAIWAGASRATIAASLAQVLRDTLAVDLVHVELRTAAGASVSNGACLAAADHDHVVTPIGINAEHGVIVTASCREGFPTETQRLLLNVAANQATLALLTDTAREESRIAEILQRIGTAVAAELDLEHIVQIVTDEVTALTGANFGAFFYNVINATDESYMLYTLAGAPREAFSRFPMPRNTAIFGPTFSGRGPMRLADVTADPRYGNNHPYRGMPEGHLPVRSYLAVPVRSRSGKVYGGLFFGHKDVGVFTERHERLAVGVAAWAALAMDNGHLYAEAQRANTAKDQFLATLSHELRTPLNAIIGWVSMLRRADVVNAAAVPKAWGAIDRNLGALTGLIEDLLDVSRIATGKLHLSDHWVDITEVVRDGARTMEPQFQEKGVELAIDMTATPCFVRGDGARLRQVFVNLLSNAVRFTTRGGRVAVALTCSDTAAVIVVSDSGIGIHPEFLPHVFERFQQGDAETTVGLGLGLAIVKNLVELHGGTVVAESGGIGQGATFTVTLPRSADQQHPA